MRCGYLRAWEGSLNHLRAVRKHVTGALTATRVVRAAFDGSLDAGLYGRYLVNAYHYAGHSP